MSANGGKWRRSELEALLAAMVREASKQISNSERHGESSRSNIDLLGQLLDDLLIKIIRLLPTEEAVRTSVLNKRWRNLWKQIHNINFSFKETEQSSLINEFRSFDKFLGYLDPSITINKFSVQFHYDPVGSHDKLDSYFSWAFEHRVKMLALDIKFPGHYPFQKLYRVPAVLFQYQFLVELELRLIVPLNVHNASWPLLKGLNLTGTKLNVMEFNNLMEASPLLERLSLVRCKLSGHNEQSSQIRICSTTLRCLKLWKCRVTDNHNHEVVNLAIDLPSLVKISMNMFLPSILDAVSYVEEVHVGQWSLQALSNDIKKSATVKHVQMEITMDCPTPWQGMANLISSYSNLHTLVVNFKEPFLRIYCLGEVFDGGDVLEHCLSGMMNLRTIHVCGIEDAEVKQLMEDTNKYQIDSLAELSRKTKFKIVRILLKKLIHLEEMWIYVAAKGCSYFGSESVLVEETRKLFEEASARPTTLQVTCKPYDSPDWSAMPEN